MTCKLCLALLRGSQRVCLIRRRSDGKYYVRRDRPADQCWAFFGRVLAEDAAESLVASADSLAGLPGVGSSAEVEIVPYRLAEV